MSTGADLPRPALIAGLVSQVKAREPLVLGGPRGSGKTTLLHAVAAALTRDGWVPVYLDLMGAASSPERFVTAALAALPAESFGRRLAQATEIRKLAGAGREHGAAAVKALLALWASSSEASGRPVALLLDEATEIRSLAYFAGLREAHKLLHDALRARAHGTLLATSFPTQARGLWPDFARAEAPPLTGADLSILIADPAVREAMIRAVHGWPRYVRILLESCADGTPVEEAWAREMEAGGRLEAACRHTYEALLLRSRGYGIAKAALAVVADEEGLNLTALVGRIGRTPGAVRDYLQWLVGVDALRMLRKRYYFVDGLLRHWVRLHARGVPASSEDVRHAARESVGASTVEQAGPGGEQVGPAEEPAAPEVPEPARVAARHDSLMEID